MPKFNVKRQAPIAKSTLIQDVPLLGVVKIIHTQSVKQSLNYNSTEATYGVEVYCPKDDDEIERTITKAEKVVEEAMLVKFKEQFNLLKLMADGKVKR